MSLALMLVLQAAVPPPAPARAVAPIEFDLARVGTGAPGRDCAAGDPGAIVVCGRRRSGGVGAYPLEEMAAIFEPGPLVAETGLIGTIRARAFVESVEIGPGQVSNRLMVGIRLPF
jgi:hypothetical protein